MKLFINQEFVNYYQRFFGLKRGDPLFIPEFDFNKDGVINILDAVVVSKAVGSWIDFGKNIIKAIGEIS